MFTYGTEGEKGSGLGLNVCKEMAALEGTTITVNSKYEQGSTFSFYLKIVE
jgi:Signal transduction histidine kinase